MTSIVVFDYGFGNVRSMVRALANLGVDVSLTANPVQAMEADGLVVPGVGAFAACMRGLHAAGGDDIVHRRLRDNRPVLGVCVGEQIMFAAGNEHGEHAEGLHLIDGEVVRLDADVVPHMGWNTVEAAPGSVLMRGVENERFYFVHSYAATHADPLPESEAANVGHAFAQADQCVSYCEYGRGPFVAAYERGPLSATQFHPEKSGEAGAQLLRNWIGTMRA
ncbi:imidazole glycerol phosphate synthase subunit HisH [Bifidobacterium magnum]|uniref:Imidazole glycerol phosphate synthase subunit HisH n=1 Tax=Bifidobacterium magnum TaxID=1692 RepID=A0A087BDV0_9BIFI|nr:imidazole glycerol phosphate synthase subunit HisH [Bifidobacterium magnum]KFI69200.1 Imidazole glycerol phosphate synthase subunit [Bifidobacterium magnum]